MFPWTKSRETSGLEENNTNWFPEGLDIESFVIFLDSNKRIIGANQNSRLGIQQQKSNRPCHGFRRHLDE